MAEVDRASGLWIDLTCSVASIRGPVMLQKELRVRIEAFLLVNCPSIADLVAEDELLPLQARDHCSCLEAIFQRQVEVIIQYTEDLEQGGRVPKCFLCHFGGG